MESFGLGAVFVLQLAVILVAARATGWAFRRFLGQPRVVGEMVAGVLLGPSLLGLAAPGLHAFLFPPETRGALAAAGQLGVGLYMFLVGLGFDRAHLRLHAVGAGGVALAGTALPFLAAAALVPWLLARPGLFGEGVGPLQATLYLGACMAITAFPVLARILDERGLTRTPLGAFALSAGALGDLGAWVVLALVLAMAPGEIAGVPPDPGLYVVLGGFAAGALIPRGPLARRLKGLVEPVTAAALAPLFFAASGLTARFDLAADPGLALVALAILAAAVAAKVGGGWAGARLAGQDDAAALGVGVLMNARGLMELIVLGVGLQHGLIEVPLYSVLVLMAVATTFMTSPLFEAVYGRRARARGEMGALTARLAAPSSAVPEAADLPSAHGP